MDALATREFSPTETLTRGEFVAEVLGIWEAQITNFERALNTVGVDPNRRLMIAGRMQEMEFARKVLANTFFASELHNTEGVLGDDPRKENYGDIKRQIENDRDCA